MEVPLRGEKEQEQKSGVSLPIDTWEVGLATSC